MPARISVAGDSGSGKTTVSGAIAARLDLPHVELDDLFHGPNDVAPSAYNEGEPREGLPQSPLPPPSGPGFSDR